MKVNCNSLYSRWARHFRHPQPGRQQNSVWGELLIVLGTKVVEAMKEMLNPMNADEIYLDIRDLAVEIDLERSRHDTEIDRLIRELLVVA